MKAAAMQPSARGFTLIELLIVVVIIGVLAAIAVPKFSQTKQKAYVANMKSDLRNLATAQESYFYDNAVYYGGALPGPDVFFRGSRGVTVIIESADAAGWSASATHTASPVTCAIFGGNHALAPAAVEGEPGCE
jgi:prepilin-type N-terminal cleavage/methylation domain-containing protein